MHDINNSTGKPNFSQRMNPDDPSTAWNEPAETCNVTAGATAMVTAGHDEKKINKGLHPRLAMDLLYFMRSNPKCMAKYDAIDPAHKTPMNEYMEVLAIGIKEYLGPNVGVAFVWSAKRDAIHGHIANGGGVVIHGNFVFRRADGTGVVGGHFQSLAGMKRNESGIVQEWTVDDPYGNPLTEYKDAYGNDIKLTMAQVDAWIKPIGPGGKDVIFIGKPAT